MLTKGILRSKKIMNQMKSCQGLCVISFSLLEIKFTIVHKTYILYLRMIEAFLEIIKQYDFLIVNLIFGNFTCIKGTEVDRRGRTKQDKKTILKLLIINIIAN